MIFTDIQNEGLKQAISDQSKDPIDPDRRKFGKQQ